MAVYVLTNKKTTIVLAATSSAVEFSQAVAMEPEVFMCETNAEAEMPDRHSESRPPNEEEEDVGLATGVPEVMPIEPNPSAKALATSISVALIVLGLLMFVIAVPTKPALSPILLRLLP